MGIIGKKCLHLLVVMFAVSLCAFLMVDALPGDAAYSIAGTLTTLEDIQAIQTELGLSGNIAIRYFDWLSSVFQGDLGVSYFSNEPVLDALLSSLPVTFELMILSQLIALICAVPCAIICAYKHQSRLDNILTGTAFTSMSIPVFVMALLLIYIFAVTLQWLPATGYVSIQESVWLNLSSLMLPALSIAMVEWVTLMRVLRSDLITTLQKDYILLARAKGLPVSHIILKHALRPSSFTLITILGLQIGHLLGGALVIETIFALPGIGRLLIGAIFNQDIPVIQGCTLLIAITYVVINFIVDILYVIVDPRIKKGFADG